MSKSIPTLAIGDIAVRQRNDLYSLNDLHKAAGNHAKQKPSEWLRNQQTQDLVTEISKAGIPTFETKRGNGAGIYAGREMVIGYAAWISAAFHLKVIRVFLNAVQPAAPYTVQPGDTLNEAQQIALRTLLEANVKRLPHDKQAGAMIQGWSKLKAHFGVSYRQIPAHEFTEALSIISRHVAQWELVDEAPKAAPAIDAIDATDAPAMAAARKVALDYFTSYRAAVKEGKGWAEMDTIPSEALQGMIADAIMRQRMIVSFDPDSGRMHCSFAGPDEFLTSWPKLVKNIASGECNQSNTELLAMTSACTGRLSTRAHRWAV